MAEQPKIIYVERKSSGFGMVCLILFIAAALTFCVVVVRMPTGDPVLDSTQVIHAPGKDELKNLIGGYLLAGNPSKYRPGFLFGLKNIRDKYPNSVGQAAGDLFNSLSTQPEKDGYLECREVLRRIQ